MLQNHNMNRALQKETSAHWALLESERNASSLQQTGGYHQLPSQTRTDMPTSSTYHRGTWTPSYPASGNFRNQGNGYNNGYWHDDSRTSAYDSAYPNQASGFPNQASGYPNQASGYPNQASVYPIRASGYPNLRWQQPTAVYNQHSGGNRDHSWNGQSGQSGNSEGLRPPLYRERPTSCEKRRQVF